MQLFKKKKYYQCEICTKKFHRKKNMEMHKKHCGEELNILSIHHCSKCEQDFSSRYERKKHIESIHSGLGLTTIKNPWKIKEKSRALNTHYVYQLIPDKPSDITSEPKLKQAIFGFKDIIREYQKNYFGNKINICLASKFNKASDPDILMSDYAYLRPSFPVLCYKSTNIEKEILQPLYTKIIQKIDTFEGVGSGWNLKSIGNIELEINVFNPLNVGAVNQHIYPQWFYRNHIISDVSERKKDDQDCFKWTVLNCLYGNKRKSTIKKSYLKQYENNIDFSMLNFPVNVFCDTNSQNNLFSKFEEKNNISLNIFTFDPEKYDFNNHHVPLTKKKEKKCKIKKKRKSRNCFILDEADVDDDNSDDDDNDDDDINKYESENEDIEEGYESTSWYQKINMTQGHTFSSSNISSSSEEGEEEEDYSRDNSINVQNSFAIESPIEISSSSNEEEEEEEEEVCTTESLKKKHKILLNTYFPYAYVK